MRVAYQLIFCIVVSVTVILLGSIFSMAFWQCGIHATNTLAGKPLPQLTAFFIENRNLPIYLFSFPILYLVGGPLLERSYYFDSERFMLRTLVFLSIESLLLLVSLFAVALPFISYYAVLEENRSTTLS